MKFTCGKRKNPIDVGGSRVNSDRTNHRFLLLWLSYIVSVILHHYIQIKYTVETPGGEIWTTKVKDK